LLITTKYSYRSFTLKIIPNNFGFGSGARFDVERVSGSYSVTLTDKSQFNNVQPDSYSGTFGVGAAFTVIADLTPQFSPLKH